MNLEMRNNALRLGIFSAIAIIALVVVFMVLVIIFPPPEPSSAREFMADYTHSYIFPVIPSFLLVLANLPFLVSLYFFADESRKPIALSGLLPGLGYVLCSGINYFLQLTVVPQNIKMGQESAVAIFSMQLPGSFGYAIDNLGYAFLSISFLFFSGIFYLRGFQGTVKSAFVVYGISGLLGTLGYMTGQAFLESFVLISAFPYLIAVILVMICYTREMRKSEF